DLRPRYGNSFCPCAAKGKAFPSIAHLAALPSFAVVVYELILRDAGVVCPVCCDVRPAAVVGIHGGLVNEFALLWNPKRIFRGCCCNGQRVGLAVGVLPGVAAVAGARIA